MMDALVDRATRAASRHPSPALRVPELARMVQGSGARVPDAVLLRALLAEPGRFRLIDPWRGPWSTLLEDRRGGWPDHAFPNPGRPRTLVDGPRLVPEAGETHWTPGPGSAALDRMRRTMIRLGWRIDDASHVDLARWHRLVLESTRVRRKLSPAS
jgi:hypothetical protein